MRRLAFASLAMLAASIPLEDVHRLPFIGTPARLLGLLTVGLTALVVIGERRIRPLPPYVLWSYLFVLWVTASLFWSVDPARTPDRIITFLQLFAMLLIVHVLCTTSRHIDVLLQASVVGSFAAALTVGQSFVLGIEAYYGRFAVPGADPNYTAVALALMIPVAWHLAGRTGQAGWRRLNLAYLVVGTGAIALTGSRAGFLSLLLAFAAIGIQAARGSGRDRMRLLLLGVVALVIVSTLVPEFIFERIALVGEEIESGDLNGRVQLWRESAAAFSDSPVLGTGAGATRSVLPTGKVAHNLVLSVAVEFGIVGLVLFLGMIVAAVSGVRHLEPARRAMFLTTFGILAFGTLSLSIETRKLLWLVVAVLGASASELLVRDDPPQDRASRVPPPADASPGSTAPSSAGEGATVPSDRAPMET